MLRAIFMIGLFAMLGLFAVGMVFKLFGGLLYFGIRILSPGTAARIREKFSGTRLTRY